MKTKMYLYPSKDVWIGAADGVQAVMFSEPGDFDGGLTIYLTTDQAKRLRDVCDEVIAQPLKSGTARDWTRVFRDDTVTVMGWLRAREGVAA